jgi:hypothetical protein
MYPCKSSSSIFLGGGGHNLKLGILFLCPVSLLIIASKKLTTAITNKIWLSGLSVPRNHINHAIIEIIEIKYNAVILYCFIVLCLVPTFKKDFRLPPDPLTVPAYDLDELVCSDSQLRQ